MEIPELRIHGVSGTPPRNMLYTDPLVAVFDQPAAPTETDKYVRLYELPGDRLGVGPNVTAFHWGSLTSGSWLTALWILLLPFSLANIAGWSARRRGPTQILIVRIFGLLLTGVFINLALIATVDFYWLWATGPGTTAPSVVRSHPNVFAGIVFLLLGWMWWGLVSWASTRSHFSPQEGRERRRLLWHPTPDSLTPKDRGPQGDEAWKDPAGTELTDPKIWDVHPILHRLRRIHFGFAYLILAFAAATASDTGLSFGAFDIPTFVVGLAIVISIATLAATGLKKGPAGRLLRHVTAWHSAGGASLLALASLAVILTKVDGGVSSTGHWPYIRDTSAALLVVCGIALIAVFVATGRVSASAVTLGVLFGLVLGAAIVFVTEDVLGDEAGARRIEGLNWAAVAMLIWALVVTLAVVSLVASRAARSGDLWKAIHDATGSLDSLWLVVPLTALGLSLIVVQQRCDPDSAANFFTRCIQEGSLPAVPTTWVRVFVFVMSVAIVGVVVTLLWRAARRQMAVLVLLGAVSLYLFLRYSGLVIGGVDLSFDDLTATARTLVIVLPAGLILTKMISGLRGGPEVRRGMAVLWDVIMFWPRWYHPMAPPAYGPHAVNRLQEEIERIQHRSSVSEDSTNVQPVIVSAHSQGTVLATMALGLMAGATHETDRDTYTLRHPNKLDRIGLLTYGCPVGHLYDRCFSSLGFTHLAKALADGLGVGGGTSEKTGRWANLYRPTDPIGGPLLPSIDIEVADPVERVADIDGEPRESPLGMLARWWRNRRGKGEPEKAPVYRMHSKYEPLARFLEERQRLGELLE